MNFRFGFIFIHYHHFSSEHVSLCLCKFIRAFSGGTIFFSFDSHFMIFFSKTHKTIFRLHSFDILG